MCAHDLMFLYGRVSVAFIISVEQLHLGHAFVLEYCSKWGLHQHASGSSSPSYHFFSNWGIFVLVSMSMASRVKQIHKSLSAQYAL